MSEKGANNAMKWLRKRKKSDRAEASPALAANEQEEVAQEKTEYIEDKTQAAAWPARAHPISRINRSWKFGRLSGRSRLAARSCMCSKESRWKCIRANWLC